MGLSRLPRSRPESAVRSGRRAEPGGPLPAALATALAAIALAAGLSLVPSDVVPGLEPARVLAATAEPTTAPGGDTRSVGEGPGLVGAPFLAIGGVLALGFAVVGLTLVYVRATGGSRPPRNRSR